MKKPMKTSVVFLVVILLFGILLPVLMAAENVDYRTIRVKISISKSSIPVVLDGEYTLLEDPNTTLTRGNYTISVVESNKVRLQGNGLDKVIGTSITFMRQAYSGSGNNYLTITGTDNGNINYLGNMSFTVNGGNLFVVNHVPLEEYLYGVVAYEMSNSFPLEALKAQAVCARGYAIKTISTSGSYDIGDTPSDQVYKGYTPSYERVIQAVDETKGQVVTYNDKIISTYFAASNGGQTELPGNTWGGGTAKNKEYPYLAQNDDPYDLENKSSLYQKIFIPKVVEDTKYEEALSIPGDYLVRIVNVNSFCNVRSGPGTSYADIGDANLGTIYQWISTTGNWHKVIFQGKEGYISSDFSLKIENGRFLYENSALNDLQIRAFNKLKALGKDIVKATDVKINTVNSLLNGLERWPATGSRSYVTANAKVTVQYFGVGEVSLASKTNLDLVMELMKPTGSGGYYISHDYLNSNLRLRSVSTASEGYYILNGRYGHGVGMSQRGAQTMAANYGKTYQQILAFYYEGTKLSNVVTTVPDPPSQETTPNLPSTEVTPNLSSRGYTINSDSIIGLSTNLKVETFLSNLIEENGTTKLVTHAGEDKASGVLVTGDVLQLKELSTNNVYKSYSIVIYGDINGDGGISLIDLLRIQKHLLNTTKLSGSYLLAADVSKDGKVSLLDLLRLQKHLLGTIAIAQ